MRRNGRIRDANVDGLARGGTPSGRKDSVQHRSAGGAVYRRERVWRSGQTKVEGFLDIKENTFFLFRDEYKVPLLPPDLAAAEHVFPVLLLVGFASRLSALGLMVMTLVIQLIVYPEGWPEHILWFALLLLIVARGPGAISLDHIIWSRAQPVMATAPR